MRKSRLALLLGARFLISCAHTLNEAESPLLGAGVHLVRLVTVCLRWLICLLTELMSPCACEKSGLVSSNLSVGIVGILARGPPRPSVPVCLSVLRAFVSALWDRSYARAPRGRREPEAGGGAGRKAARRHVENRGCPNSITIRPFSVPPRARPAAKNIPL